MVDKIDLSHAADQRSRGVRGSRSASRSSGPLPPHVLPSRAERRPEMLRQRREGRRQASVRQNRQRLLIRVGVATAGLLLLAGLGYLIFAAVQRNQIPEGTREFEVIAGHTVEPVAYDPTPPVGGEHDGTPQTCGFYSLPVWSENAVHSLEHGAVWITYRPDLPLNQADRLRTLAEEEGKVLVSPYGELPAPVVASSWGRQLWLDSADDGRLEQFVQRFRGAAPEPAAPCIGVGTPL